MALEITYERAGYYLEYLQSLNSEMEKLANVSGLNIRWMIDRLCIFSCESDFSRSKRDYSMSENWTQLLSVCHNLLCRGVPTYPTFHIEKLLISEAAKAIPIGESNDEQIVAFRDQLNGVEKEKLLRFLVKAHAAIDHRCKEPHGNQESDGERAFLEYASEEIGPSVFQVIESQRPFSTMTKASGKEEYLVKIVHPSSDYETAYAKKRA
ncbi:MAG: hypothetical protein JSV05_03915 [Candidatus Bathyarchaeota archaeon]|nr:MAG: hypothetical protein JSV05_03915 [Candidatus Bathyarchaeota archaeon]